MKKVLSFVLSVAMVICLMPMMAFADDDTTNEVTATGLSQFSDADSIKNKEAVAVLVGLGVIDGMGDGTFQPEGNLTRAQASKLVATVVKSGDKSDIPAPAADPFTDVAKSHWAAGAVQFGVENDYINGMGDGTFHPDDNVTTAQLATMLEKLLGFTVSDVNYNWPENAMAIAKGGQTRVHVNLLEGITKGAGEDLTRDDAALMIFNALEADDVVKASTTGGTDVDGTTGYSPIASQKEGYRGFVDGTEQLIEKYFPKATYIATDIDDFGRDKVSWKNGRTQITDDVIDVPDYVYTAKMTEKDLKADLDGYEFGEEGAPTFINGVQIFEASDIETIAELTGNGVLVEVYTNEKDTAITKVIVVAYECVEVTAVDAKNETVTVHSDVVGEDLEVNSESKAYDVLSSMEEGAVVFVAVNGDEILDAYAATEVTGAITKKVTSKGIITLGGKDYELQAFADADEFAVNANDNGTGYLDKYGYLAAYAPEKVESAVADWLLVKDVYSNTSTSATDKYVEEGNETTTTYYVLGVNEAGEVVDLQLNTNDGKGKTDATVATLKWAKAQLKGAPSGTAADGSARVAAKFFEEGLLVTYAETANGYTIGTEDELSEAVAVDTIQEKVAKIDGNYVSKDVNTITVTGEKASEVAATITQGVEKIENGANYILDKSDEKKPLVRTIFAENVAPAKDEAIVYRVKALDTEVSYEDADGNSQVGFAVDYYSAESADPQNITVTEAVADGWYTCEPLEDVEDVYVLEAYEAGENDAVKTASGSIASSYESTVTIGDAYYNIPEDSVVRDLREDGSASSVKDLKDGLQVEFAYTTDEKTNVNTITQLYVVETPEGAAN